MLNILSTEEENILAGNYVKDLKIEEKTIGGLKDEYKFNEIKDVFDEGAVSRQLDAFMEATMLT